MNELNRILEEFRLKKKKEEEMRLEQRVRLGECSYEETLSYLASIERKEGINQEKDDILDATINSMYKNIIWTEKRLKEDRENRDYKHWRNVINLAEEDRYKLILFYLKDKSRSATIEEYKKWLHGFIKNGGEPTHSYDRPFDETIFLATRDFKAYPLFGSQSIGIIVPENVKFLGGELGHSNLYFMDRFKHRGVTGWIPVYNNITF